MNCAETRELLSGYLDDELPGDLRERVRHHIEACTSCGRELASFLAISAMAKQLPSLAAPPEIWSRLSQNPETAAPRIGTRWANQNWRRTYSVIGLVAASVLILAGIMLGTNRLPHSDHTSEAQHFAEFARRFPTDPGGAQRLLLTGYNGRPASTEELSKSPHYTPLAASNPPAGYAFQQAYVLEMSCCRCSQVVLRRESGGLVTVFEHEDAQTSDWTSGFRCSNKQCGTTPCTIAETGEYLAVSCRVDDRHFTIVGASNHREVETLVAWLEQSANGPPDRSGGRA